jgi:hypothetical protein
MRTTVYKCDHCKRAIGEKPHISLSFGQFSGIALPPFIYGTPYWGVFASLNGKFLHFCRPDHLGQFFAKLMQDVMLANEGEVKPNAERKKK